LTDQVDVVVIGGGFGGQLAAARLSEAGFDDLRIIEKGGTSAARGIGIGIPARSATSSRTSICRCSKTSVPAERNTPSHRKY
jgi:glycine/D-amino acid oxidase-like deaminating enzyme